MKCSQCGKDVPVGSKFCLDCGASMTSAPRIRRVETPASAPVNKRKLGVLAAIAAAVIILIIILALTMLQGGEEVVVMNPLPSPPQAPVLDTQPAPPAPVQEEKKPPAEVVAYLQHVKQVETQRQSMRLDLTPAFEMLKNAQSMRLEPDEQDQQQAQQNVSSGMEAYTQQWTQLVQYLATVSPPSGCEQLGSVYTQALGKYSATMIKINYAMSTQDIGALMQLQSSAQADVDTTLMQADHELASVCTAYGITKDFSIQPDNSMTSLLSPGQ